MGWMGEGNWGRRAGIVAAALAAVALFGGTQRGRRPLGEALPLGEGVMIAESSRPMSGETVQGWMSTEDGGYVRHLRWDPPRASGPASASVVLLNGRAEVMEKYGEVVDDLLRRGYRVFSFDWRGQGLSSRFLDNPHKNHIRDYGIFVDDLARYIDTVVRPAEAGAAEPGTPARPLVLIAHSMGGQVALRYLIRVPDRFAAVVLSSPMTDLVTAPWPRPLAEMASRLASGFGFSGAYAFGQHDYDPATDAEFAGNPLTHDPARHRVLYDLYRAHPEMAVGGVTFGWLAASFRAAALTAVPGALEGVTVPVLVLSAPQDRLVNAETHPVLCQKLHRCTLFTLPDSAHEPLMEVDAIRDRAWAEIDRFLAPVLTSSALARPPRPGETQPE